MMEDDVICYQELGERLRKRRRALHFTQEQLSERAGISLSFLGHIERGSRKPSLETIAKLCIVLRISADYILLGAPVDGEDCLDNLIAATQEYLNRMQDIRRIRSPNQK